MLAYAKKFFKDIQKGARVALPVKNKSLYLTTEGTIEEVSTVRLFKVVEINENRSSETFTAELMEIGFSNKNTVQPLIFEPETEVFEVVEVSEDDGDISVNTDKDVVKVKKDNRKVIKG